MTDNIHILPRSPLDLHVNEKGKLLNSFHNALVILRNDEGFRGALAFDQFSRLNIVNHDAKGTLDNRNGFPRPATDDDYARIHDFLQRAGLRNLNLTNTREAIDLIANTNSFHPVLDYLETIEWHQEKHLTLFLPTCFGTPSDDYHRAIGKMFLISMVARIYEPGCKADYMLIIEGDQGRLKSIACEALATPWFSDHLPDINSKDASVHLRGKWLIEVAELHRFDKADSLQLKSFITRKEERYRPPYGHAEVIEPRQNLFIGTTNKDAYLKDETGGRRFWPFKAGKIRVDHLEQIRDQLFAEAVHEYKAGINWWPDHTFEDNHIKEHQLARYDGDTWQDLIAEFLKDRTEPVTILEIAKSVLGYATQADINVAISTGTPSRDTHINRFGTADQNRVKRVLASLGWQRAGRNTANVTIFRR